MPSFGEWLRDERESRKLTLQELVDKGAECTTSYLSNLERNYPATKDGEPPRPSKRVAASIGRALGCGEEAALEVAGYVNDKPDREELSQFAERLRAIMAMRQIGASELAERIGGLSAQGVSQWTLGHTAPRFDKLVPLAQALGVELDWLVSGNPAKAPIMPAYQTETTAIYRPDALAALMAPLVTQLSETNQLLRDFSSVRRKNNQVGAMR